MPSTFPCGRIRIKLKIEEIPQRALWVLSTSCASSRHQVPKIRISAAAPITIKAIGTATIHPYVVIRYTSQGTIIQVIIIGKLAHIAYAYFSFSKAGFLNYSGVLAYAYGRKYAYDDDYD